MSIIVGNSNKKQRTCRKTNRHPPSVGFLLVRPGIRRRDDGTPPTRSSPCCPRCAASTGARRRQRCSGPGKKN